MTSGSVVVVGAGIAGLTAAYYLSKRGFDVTVLEASERVGGRMSTDRIGGYVLDRGAQFLSDGYPVLGELIDELGLADNLCSASGWTGIVRSGAVRRINTLHPWSPALSGLLSWRDTLRVARGSLALARKTKRLPLSDYSSWHALDDADAAEWIAAAFGNGALEYLFEPMLEGFYFQAPEQMSRAWPAIVWSFGMRRKGATALTNGIGSIPETLANRLNVSLSTVVESIDTTATDVLVNTSAGVLHADYVVLATTASAARTIYAPAHDVEARLLGTSYSASINICLAVPEGVSTAKVRNDIYGLLIPRQERQVISAIALESRKCPQYVPRGELMNVMLSGLAGERLARASEEEVLAEVLPELEVYFPSITRKIAFAHFCRWPEAEPRSPIGRSTWLRQYRELWDPSMKVILAGDYMSIPCTEGAAESGRWSATAVAKAFSRGSDGLKVSHGCKERTQVT
ncbi:MAG: FAD-dependent oxidoreductase [Burkholderiales bacterium]|nr:FAD-dependent oxidoreductase [Burkholderiales bacterium]